MRNVRALMHYGSGNGSRLKAPQSVMQFGAIVRKIENRLARCGKDGGTVRGLERSQMAVGSVSNARQIAENQMDIVKKIRDVVLRYCERCLLALRVFSMARIRTLL